jgi:FeS assembly SUF system protein
MRIYDSAEERERRKMTPTATAGVEDPLRAAVVDAIKGVYDPEIPVNVYDLGLIYDVRVSPASRSCVVVMTLTTVNCPEAQTLPGEVQHAAESVEGIDTAHVNLVFEPAWDKSRISDEAKLHLGLL